MAEDREVLKELWSGYVPVHFSLNAIEVVTMKQPEPYYAMVPRMTYFPLVIDKVTKYFLRFVTQIKSNCQDLWIEFEGQPLKWNYPVGLLFDLMGKDIKLPWNLTIHFENFPEDEIMRLNSRPLIEANFMSTIKEADFLKHRSLIINSMQKKDHNQLWLGLINDKFDQFWQVNRKLMEKINGELFRLVPVRFYKSTENHYEQIAIKPMDEHGHLLTFGQLLSTFFSRTDNIDLEEQKSKWRFVTHGIEPPLETPLQWLSEHFSYPDNFLHICLLERA